MSDLTPLAIAQIAASAAFVAIGFVHVMVWIRLPQAWQHPLFALTTLGAAANAIAEWTFYRANSIEAFNVAFKWSNSVNAMIWLPALLWFIAVYTGDWRARRWITTGLSGLMFAAGLLNVFLPYGFLFREITALRSITLPWGERIVVPLGDPSPWRIFTDLMLVGLLVLAIDAGIRLWKAGDRTRALALGGSLTFFSLLILVVGALIDIGWLRGPYPFTYGYLAVALVVSSYLAMQVARESKLSFEMEENARRWRVLFTNVHLLVVQIDTVGRLVYVNPFWQKTTGYAAQELESRSIFRLVPEDKLAAFEARIAEIAGSEDEAPPIDSALITKPGSRLEVTWTGMRLGRPNGALEGVLLVGMDCTDQRRAEEERDHALMDVKNALRQVQALKRQLEEEVIYLKEEISSTGGFTDIIGESDEIRYVLQKIKQVAPLHTTILLSGETGVGKELVARAIHQHSPRRAKSMVKVNCAALPATLIETELFGHERGAFTGATRRRKGRFELADGGTILLDEVSEIPLEIQSKLLRVVQDGEFTRVGGDRPIRVDVRIIAATNRPLQSEVEAGRFREDLYYRLNVYPITVPALRQRRTDIPLLIRFFAQKFCKLHRRSIDQIPQAVMEELVAYEWPGNVRELQNIVERAVITSQGNQLSLTSRLSAGHAAPTVGGSSAYRGTLEQVEKEYVVQMLEQSGWRIEGQGGASELLDLHPSTLRARMRRLGIKKPGS